MEPFDRKGDRIQVPGISIGPAPFYFRQRHGRIDWEKLRGVDIDQVVREVDLRVLQEFLDEVTFSNISEEDLPPARGGEDPAKLVRLSQLTIEYLLHVQESQEACIQGLSRQLNDAKRDKERLKVDAKLATKDGLRMKRASAQNQFVVATCQALLRQYGIDPRPLFALGRGSVPMARKPEFIPQQGIEKAQPKKTVDVLEEAFFGVGKGIPRQPTTTRGDRELEAALSVSARVCHVCGKAFSSQEFLEKHRKRRHPEGEALQHSLDPDANRGEAPLRPTSRSPPSQTSCDPPSSSAGRKNTRSGSRSAKGDVSGKAMRRNARAKQDDPDEDEEEDRVEEGARRLGELVREREHAKLRSEIQALRSEIGDLKTRGGTPPAKDDGLRNRSSDDELRRRRVRGVISVRRMFREFDMRRKAGALKKWRRTIDHVSSSRPLPSSGSADTADVPSLTPLADAAALAAAKAAATCAEGLRRFPGTGETKAAWNLRDALSAVHRRADQAALKAAGSLGPSVLTEEEYATPSPTERAHHTKLASGMDVSSYFRVDPRKAEAAREHIVKELRNRARGGCHPDVDRPIVGDEEQYSRVEHLLDRREKAVSCDPALEDAAALVKKELRLAQEGKLPETSTTAAPAEGGIVDTDHATSGDFPKPVTSRSSGGAMRSSLFGESAKPPMYAPRTLSACDDCRDSRRTGLTGVERQEQRSSFNMGHTKDDVGESLGSNGFDSKEMLAVAKRTAEISWEVERRRRSTREIARTRQKSSVGDPSGGNRTDSDHAETEEEQGTRDSIDRPNMGFRGDHERFIISGDPGTGEVYDGGLGREPIAINAGGARTTSGDDSSCYGATACNDGRDIDRDNHHAGAAGRAPSLQSGPVTGLSTDPLASPATSPETTLTTGAVARNDRRSSERSGSVTIGAEPGRDQDCREESEAAGEDRDPRAVSRTATSHIAGDGFQRRKRREGLRFGRDGDANSTLLAFGPPPGSQGSGDEHVSIPREGILEAPPVVTRGRQTGRMVDASGDRRLETVEDDGVSVEGSPESNIKSSPPGDDRRAVRNHPGAVKRVTTPGITADEDKAIIAEWSPSGVERKNGSDSVRGAADGTETGGTRSSRGYAGYKNAIGDKDGSGVGQGSDGETCHDVRPFVSVEQTHGLSSGLGASAAGDEHARPSPLGSSGDSQADTLAPGSYKPVARRVGWGMTTIPLFRDKQARQSEGGESDWLGDAFSSDEDGEEEKSPSVEQKGTEKIHVTSIDSAGKVFGAMAINEGEAGMNGAEEKEIESATWVNSKTVTVVQGGDPWRAVTRSPSRSGAVSVAEAGKAATRASKTTSADMAQMLDKFMSSSFSSSEGEEQPSNHESAVPAGAESIDGVPSAVSRTDSVASTTTAVTAMTPVGGDGNLVRAGKAKAEVHQTLSPSPGIAPEGAPVRVGDLGERIDRSGLDARVHGKGRPTDDDAVVFMKDVREERDEIKTGEATGATPEPFPADVPGDRGSPHLGTSEPASGHGRSVSPVEEIGGSGPLSVRRKGLRATRDEGGTAGSSAEEEDGGALHSKGSSARGEGHSVFNVVTRASRSAPDGEGMEDNGAWGVRRPRYGSFGLGSGLSAFPKRRETKCEDLHQTTVESSEATQGSPDLGRTSLGDGSTDIPYAGRGGGRGARDLGGPQKKQHQLQQQRRGTISPCHDVDVEDLA